MSSRFIHVVKNSRTSFFLVVVIFQSLSHVRLFCDPVNCRPSGFSVHGISQARILEWVAISFSRGSSRPRDQTWTPYIGNAESQPLDDQESYQIFSLLCSVFPLRYMILFFLSYILIFPFLIFFFQSLSSNINGLLRWLSGKESTCQCMRPGLDPRVEKIPQRRKWLYPPLFLPEKFHGQRSLAGYSS